MSSIPSTPRRVVPIISWAPAQETISENKAVPAAVRRNSMTYWQQPSLSAPPASDPERTRSVILSKPWTRRPRAATHSVDHGTGPTRASGESHDLEGTCRKSAAFPAPKPEPPDHVRGILRRASLSIKTGVRKIVTSRTSLAGPSSVRDTAETRGSSWSAASRPPARPTTSSSTRGRLLGATSFCRHTRRAHTDHDHGKMGVLPPLELSTLPIPGSGEQPPFIPRSSGAAARQAAASACNDLHGPAAMAVPKPKWLTDESGMDDHESGIGIAITSEDMGMSMQTDAAVSDGDDEVAAGISKLDFVARLPVELAMQVLGLLDLAALTTASGVSKTWKTVIETQHVWRDSFLREKTATYATSEPVRPGTGLGVPVIAPDTQWKEMYRVREELDRRWKDGKARPVYLNGHADSIYCLQFDESTIITGSRDKTIRIWDMHTFACKLVIGPPDVINDPSLSLLYDTYGRPTHFATLPASEGRPTGQDGDRARASTPSLVSFPTHHNASILCLQYDEHMLVTGSSDASCIVHNPRSGYRPMRRLRFHTAAVLNLVFDDKHIVTCSKDVSICVWDRATGNLLRQLRGHAGPVNAVQMRGNTIVSCSGDSKVKLWNIDTGKNIREFQGHTKGLACSQFSEDGRYVASAGNDKVIRIWDANTGECLQELRAHENLVRSLHIDSVSGRLVSGSYDSDIKVWDMATGQPLLDFPHWHTSWVMSAKTDYRRIVSSGQDPKVLIMDFGAGIRGIEMLESRDRRPVGPDLWSAKEVAKRQGAVGEAVEVPFI